MGEQMLYNMIWYDGDDICFNEECNRDQEPEEYTDIKTLKPWRMGVGPEPKEKSFWRQQGQTPPMYEWVYKPAAWREYTDPRFKLLVVEGKVERGRVVTAEEADNDPELRRTGQHTEVQVINLNDLFGEQDVDPGDENKPSKQAVSTHEINKVTLELAMSGMLPELLGDGGNAKHEMSHPRNFTHAKGCPCLN